MHLKLKVFNNMYLKLKVSNNNKPLTHVPAYFIHLNRKHIVLIKNNVLI